MSGRHAAPSASLPLWTTGWPCCTTSLAHGNWTDLDKVRGIVEPEGVLRHVPTHTLIDLETHALMLSYIYLVIISVGYIG